MRAVRVAIECRNAMQILESLLNYAKCKSLTQIFIASRIASLFQAIKAASKLGNLEAGSSPWETTIEFLRGWSEPTPLPLLVPFAPTPFA